MWSLLPILALIAALVALHFWWRYKYLRATADARQQLDQLQAEHHQVDLQVRTRQDTLLNSMIEGLVLLDHHDRIQLANRAFNALFDVNGDVHNKTLLEVVRRPELSAVLKKVAAEQQVLDCELQTGALRDRWLQINAATLLNSDGSRQGTVLVFHDLTRLKQLERTREEFVANVSHELRTPLSLIKGYAETLLGGAKDNPKVQTRFLQTIQHNAERLQFLIEDLLAISELESGRITLNLQPVPLRPLATRVLDDLKSQAARTEITLINDLPELTARADADRLQQVLANLLDNAVKYGRTKGQVTLTGRRLDDHTLELCVRDNGPGIPPESLDRIFERFYRVDKARSREQGGTGLGLSIVKHIVQTHGGRIWAKSEPGHGAAFFFTLPAQDQP